MPRSIWAFSKPVRKIYYNLTVTGLSIAVALVIGTIELLSLLGSELGLQGAFWNSLSTLSINSIGFIIVGLFVAAWAAGMAIWKYGRIEEKGTVALRRATVEND